MSAGVAIMYVVAAVVGGAGLAMLLALLRPRSERQVYALRMVGIMALSGGVVLAMSATLMWGWDTAPAP